MPFFRGVKVLKISHFFNREGNPAQPFEGGGNLADTAVEGRLEVRQRPPVVNRAERLWFARGALGNQRVATGLLRRYEEPSQEFRAKVGHIAGRDQVPFPTRIAQSCHDAAERALARVQVGNDAKTQAGVGLRAPDQGRVTGGLFHSASGKSHEGFAAELEKGLILAHPRAVPAGQYVSRLASGARHPIHREMIPLGFADPAAVAPGVFSSQEPNILMRFCFTLGWVFTIAVLLPVAEAGSPSGSWKSVVRSDPRTGRLVRSVVVSPKAVPAKKTSAKGNALRVNPPAGPPSTAPEGAAMAGALTRTVEEIAARNSVPPQLLHSVIKVESNYNPFAVSSKGALGLMQLIPATARRFGVEDVFNPSENIAGGAKYLRYLLDLYHNDYQLALAAYNAGEGAVARYGGVPPYAETQSYVALVRKQLEARIGTITSKTLTEAQLAQPEPAGVPHIREIVEPDGSVRYISR